MLTETVLAEEDFRLPAIGHHGVGPVQHGRFDEKQVVDTGTEGVAGLDYAEFPFRCVEETVKTLFASFRYVNGGVRA